MPSVGVLESLFAVSDRARGIRIDRPAFLPIWSCHKTRTLSFHRLAFPQHVVALPEFLKLERIFPIWIHFRSFNSFTNVISFNLNQHANPTPSVRSFYLRKRRRWAIFVGPRDCERNTYFRNCRGCQHLFAPRASPRSRRTTRLVDLLIITYLLPPCTAEHFAPRALYICRIPGTLDLKSQFQSS